ncbi:MAG: CCA tRNA nucleotidyltransferase [Longimicrobiaceae bacterium]
MKHTGGSRSGEGDAPPALRAPPEVVRIARRLEEAGFSTWAVGGAVRDALAGEEPGDWDLTTAARPGEIRRLFRRTVPIGIEHGTVGVLGKDGWMYEVTTFRRDVETDGRHARVVFADSVDEDLARRDFTINAVAWHPLTHEVRDPHGGVSDLRKAILRTVGDPAERFREDRLRALRAIRFAGRFDLRIDPATWEATRASAPDLHHLSAERVREELLKTLRQTARASEPLGLYRAAGVLDALYPELAALEPHEWEATLATVDAVPQTRPLLRVAALLARAAGAAGQAQSAAAARGVLRRLRMSNADTDRVVHLVAHLGTLPPADASDADVRRWLRRVGRDFVADLLRLEIAAYRGREGPGADLVARLRRGRGMLRTRPPLAVADLAIGGRELRALGIAPGPRYGAILDALLERVLDAPEENTPERLLARVEELLAEDV